MANQIGSHVALVMLAQEKNMRLPQAQRYIQEELFRNQMKNSELELEIKSCNADIRNIKQRIKNEKAMCCNLFGKQRTLKQLDLSDLKADLMKLENKKERLQLQRPTTASSDSVHEDEITSGSASTQASSSKTASSSSSSSGSSSGSSSTTEQFIGVCRTKGCRGFFNKQGFCSLCEKTLCVDCMAHPIVKGSHKCCEEDKATLLSLKKDENMTRCPKCMTWIFRPFGCDHMFCTVKGCETSFSFSTGLEISHTTNTNPLLKEWMIKNGDRSSRCGHNGRLVSWDSFYHYLEPYLEALQISPIISLENIGNLHGCLEAMIRERNCTHRSTDDAKLSLAVKFLKCEIDETKWQQHLKRIWKKDQKDSAVNDLLIIFTNQMVGYISHIVHIIRNHDVTRNPDIVEDISNVFIQMEAFRCLFNNQAIEIGKGFVNNMMPWITEEWKFKRCHRESSSAISSSSSAPSSLSSTRFFSELEYSEEFTNTIKRRKL
jgi:hypothetical protein